MGSKDKDAKKKKKNDGLSAVNTPVFPDQEADAPANEPGQPSASEPQPSSTAAPVVPATPPKKKKKRRTGLIIFLVVLVLALVAGYFLRQMRQQRVSTAGDDVDTYTVALQDMTVTLGGSGTLQPADSYTLTSLVSGDILDAPFEEGDIVSKDAVLYTVDNADAAVGVEQAQSGLDNAQIKYDYTCNQLNQLDIKADGSGIVVSLLVEKGDQVVAGQTVALLRDSSVVQVAALFPRSFTDTLTVGTSADVTPVGTSDVYTGTVSAIDVADTVLPDGTVARVVTINVSNPGPLAPSVTADVTIGTEATLAPGSVAYRYEGAAVARASGKVSKIYVSEGSAVTKGDLLVRLQSDALDEQIQYAYNSLQDAKRALENQTEILDSYLITSPISGTIVEKLLKQGDTLRAGEMLCTVFDLSHLTLTLNVDELDIKKVESGQSVTITAAAAPGVEYSGVVTRINIKGTTLNGVTTYPVTIRIDDTDGLLPGMNVDATITVSNLTDVVAVPVDAVLRNNFVLIKSDDSDVPVIDGVPAGYAYTEVTLGESNDAYIVVTDGLAVGDVIAVLDTTPSSYDTDMFTRPSNSMQTMDGDAG